MRNPIILVDNQQGSSRYLQILKVVCSVVLYHELDKKYSVDQTAHVRILMSTFIIQQITSFLLTSFIFCTEIITMLKYTRSLFYWNTIRTPLIDK